MKATSSKTASQELAGEIQLARLRVAKAESQLKSAKQQARLARSRRKEARQAARRAKKQAKLAKQEFAEARLALAEAEAKLVRSRKRTVRSRTRKTAAAQNEKPVARPAASPVRKSPKARASKPARGKPASSNKLKVRKAAQPIAIPRDLEKPTATVSSLGGQAMVQTEEASEESRTGKTEAGSLDEPAASESQTH